MHDNIDLDIRLMQHSKCISSHFIKSKTLDLDTFQCVKITFQNYSFANFSLKCFSCLLTLICKLQNFYDDCSMSIMGYNRN
jgi:hypothetical protein